MISKEYGIFLIKPDGIKAGIAQTCVQDFLKNNLFIENHRYVYIKQEEIKMGFYYQTEAFYQYLQSGVSCAYLLYIYKDDVESILYKIKRDIRNKFHVTNKDMRNYVHSSNSGLEFFLQRKIFFPEYCENQYSGGADFVVWPKQHNEHTILNIKNVLRQSNLISICICLPFRYYSKLKRFYERALSQETKKIHFSYLRQYLTEKGNCSVLNLVTQYDKSIPILYKFSVPQKQSGNICYDDINSYNEFVEIKYERIIDNVIYELRKKYGIQIEGIVVNDSLMTLEEANGRFIYAQKKNMLKIRGSGKGGWENFGFFSMGGKETKIVETILKKQ